MPDPSDWFTTRRFALLLALLIGAAFPDVWFGAQGFFYRDYGVLAYPTVFYHRESFWRGELPLWNPLSNCGVPFLAQWGAMTLYPGALIYLLLPLPWSLGVFCLGHLFLAGLGVYVLARRWVGNGFGASLAGVAFAFNGVTLSCLLWPNYLVALGWMPWVVLLVERAWREGGRLIVLAGLVSALQLLAGVPEIALVTWLLLGGCWLVGPEDATQPAPGLSPGAGARVSRPRSLGRVALVLVLVLGVTAAQTLPFLDLLAHSQRDRSFATAKWSLPVSGWANLFLPLAGCYQTVQGIYFQHGQEFFSSIYLGAGPLVLAGWVAGRSRPRRVLLLAALALLGLALALGEQGPLYRLMRWAFPFTGVARYPVKFVLLTAFVAPLLAAYAAGGWLPLPGEGFSAGRRGVWVSALVLFGLMAGVLWAEHDHPAPMQQWPAVWRNAVARGVLLVLALGLWGALRRFTDVRFCLTACLGLLALVWFDFLTHVPRQNPTLPAACFQTGLVELNPPPRLGEGRVLITPRAEEALLRSRVPQFQQDFIGKRLALWSNLNLLEGIAKVNGSATLQVREQAQVQALLYANPQADLPALADFLGARFVTSPSNVVEWTSRPTARPLITAGQQPRFVTGQAALGALGQTDFDSSRVVYLPVEAQPFAQATNATAAEVLAPEFGAHRIEFDVVAEAPAWVVIAQSFYHCWQPYVNDDPTRLWRANHAFQALEVPAGRSRVRLAYVDRRFHLGVGLSALALLGCAVLWIACRKAATPATSPLAADGKGPAPRPAPPPAGA